MFHTPLLSRPTSLVSEHGPVAPHDYVRLRRQAAGLDIAQTAARLCVAGDDQAAVRAIVRMLERPGVIARERSTIAKLVRAFPIDAEVYHQLATEPAESHPRICRGCGCSQDDACQQAEHGPCNWAGPEICTRCTDGDHL
ncbi:hypothetical protein [Sphingomonas sp. LT1P40]|uniref:hypothetical protein n=1 Tax=Alteristakelama amylovorans TaxID=3096166 RepID=UPI002FC8F3E9